MKMSKPVSIGLVGVGGYAKFYLSALLDKTDSKTYRIEGIVDPFADRCPRLDELKARKIPIYETMEEFHANHSAELVTIATPIHLHCRQTCQALANGSNVLCEKPLGTRIQEAQRMIEARDQAGKFVAIGYQWSYSAAVQELKKDIMSGRLGRPIRLRTLVLWPRNESYYGRNNWAGKKDDGKGNWILDSPVNNATAHYLHNMFYVLGEQVDRSAVPVRVVAELYRANNITNYDTAVMRCVTDGGAELLYYVSHAVENERGPDFIYEFENASVCYEGRGSTIETRFDDGSTKSYGDPSENVENKLWDSMKAVHGAKTIVCGPEAASSQTLCMNGMQESMPEIVQFPKDLIRIEGEPGKRLAFVEGLADALTRCYEPGKLPSELALPWAFAGKEIDLTDYKSFPSDAYSRV